MEFVQNQYIQTVAVLTALISAPLVLIQSFRTLIPLLDSFRAHREASRIHVDNVTNISIDHKEYMAACVLILIVRIFGALFAVIMSSMLVIAALFLHAAKEPSVWVDYLSLIFLAISSIFLSGTLFSAKRFSDTVREKVAPNSTHGRKLI